VIELAQEQTVVWHKIPAGSGEKVELHCEHTYYAEKVSQDISQSYTTQWVYGLIVVFPLLW
jgi:hypothetical protein